MEGVGHCTAHTHTKARYTMNDGCNYCRADEGREVAGVLGVEGVGHDATYARWGLELERDESQ